MNLFNASTRAATGIEVPPGQGRPLACRQERRFGLGPGQGLRAHLRHDVRVRAQRIVVGVQLVLLHRHRDALPEALAQGGAERRELLVAQGRLDRRAVLVGQLGAGGHRFLDEGLDLLVAYPDVGEQMLVLVQRRQDSVGELLHFLPIDRVLVHPLLERIQVEQIGADDLVQQDDTHLLPLRRPQRGDRKPDHRGAVEHGVDLGEADGLIAHLRDDGIVNGAHRFLRRGLREGGETCRCEQYGREDKPSHVLTLLKA